MPLKLSISCTVFIVGPIGCRPYNRFSPSPSPSPPPSSPATISFRHYRSIFHQKNEEKKFHRKNWPKKTKPPPWGGGPRGVWQKTTFFPDFFLLSSLRERWTKKQKKTYKCQFWPDIHTNSIKNWHFSVFFPSANRKIWKLRKMVTKHLRAKTNICQYS